MFGCVVANFDKLTEEEVSHYRSCYCGLCNALGKRHGTLSRITINYDMTFLVLLLSSLYKEDYTAGEERCLIRPARKHNFHRNKITDYAADMNIILAYYNFLDDWSDDNNLFSLAEAKLLKKKYLIVKERYPNRCESVKICLEKLSEIEKSGELNPDIPSNCFGQLMGEIFVMEGDEYAEALRGFGHSLGKFIYIMDACIDLKKDIERESYNPMITATSDNFPAVLNILMADCIEKYKHLNIGKDRNLLENILYSGIWTKFETTNRESKRIKKHDLRPI